MALLSRMKPFRNVSIIKSARKSKLITVTAFVSTCGYGYFLHNNFYAMKNKVNADNEEKSVYIYLPLEEQAAHTVEKSDNQRLLPAVEQTFKSVMCHKLIDMTKCEDKEIRNKALRALAIMQLEDYHYQTVAQMIDIKTAVELARMKEASLKFFRNPSSLLFIPEVTVEEHLLQIFSEIPQSTSIKAIQCKTNEATDLLLSDNAFNSDTDDIGVLDSVLYYKKRDQNTSVYYKICLDALLAHSTISSHRHIMVEKRLLSLLHRLHECNNSDEINILIAQIIGNIALEKNLQRHIFITGWIGVLASWSRSCNVQLSICAMRALENMDGYEKNYVYDDGIYLLYPQFRNGNHSTDVDVVFVHGVMGSAFRTWRQHDSMKSPTDVRKNPVRDPDLRQAEKNVHYTFCWPKDWLANDIPLLRLVAVDYSSYFTKWKTKYSDLHDSQDLQKRSSDLLVKLIRAGVGKRPVVFVCHSMGGIIIKQMLVNAAASEHEEFSSVSKMTVGVVFYSVPHRGTEAANFRPHSQIIFKPSAEIQQLKKDSPLLLELHEEFRKLVGQQNIRCVSFGETLKSKVGLKWNEILVPLDSADPGFGEFYELKTDHLNTCKPLSKESPSYKLFVEFIEDIIENNVNRSVMDVHATFTEVHHPSFDWFMLF